MSGRVCPNCGTELEPYCEADIGVGVQSFGPWGCPACHWVDEPETYLAEDELREREERVDPQTGFIDD